MVSTPTNLSFANPGDPGFTLSWDAVSDISGYRIYRSTVSGSTVGDYTVIDEVSGQSSYQDTTVNAHEQYFYRVTAYLNSFQFSLPGTTDQKDGSGWNVGAWDSGGSSETESGLSNEVSGVYESGSVTADSSVEVVDNSSGQATVEPASATASIQGTALGNGQENGHKAINSVIESVESGQAAEDSTLSLALSRTLSAEEIGKSSETPSMAISSGWMAIESAKGKESILAPFSADLRATEHGAGLENSAIEFNSSIFGSETANAIENGALSHLVEIIASDTGLAVEDERLKFIVNLDASETLSVTLTPSISTAGEINSSVQFKEAFPSELTRNLHWDYDLDRRGFVSNWVYRGSSTRHDTIALYIKGTFGRVDPVAPTVVIDYDENGNGTTNKKSEEQSIYTDDEPITFPSLRGEEGYYRILLKDLRPSDLLSGVFFGPSH